MVRKGAKHKNKQAARADDDDLPGCAPARTQKIKSDDSAQNSSGFAASVLADSSRIGGGEKRKTEKPRGWCSCCDGLGFKAMSLACQAFFYGSFYVCLRTSMAAFQILPAEHTHIFNHAGLFICSMATITCAVMCSFGSPGLVTEVIDHESPVCFAQM